MVVIGQSLQLLHVYNLNRGIFDMDCVERTPWFAIDVKQAFVVFGYTYILYRLTR
jgi:hypothetical protein